MLRLAIVSLACWWTSCACAAQPLDLPKAINMGLERNPELLRMRLAIESGQLREADAAMDFRPNVLPEFSSARFGSDSASRLGVRATQKLEWGSVVSASVGEVHSSSDGSHLRPSKRFEIQQPLFRSFGAEANSEVIRQAASASVAARRRYELQRADLVLQVVQTYENILRLREQRDADRQAYERSDALYRVTQAKEGIGKTSRVDTLRVALLRGQAQSRLEAGEKRISSAERDLAGELGLPIDTVFMLDPAPALDLAVPAPDAAIAVALANRLDYAQALQDYDDARRAARLAGRRTMPDLRLTVSYDDFPTTFTSFGSVPFGKPLWFVGLSVGTDFNLARERIAVRQAQIAEASTEQALSILKQAISRQVMQQLDGYERALVEVKIADENLELADRRAKLTKALFDLGRTDSFTVTDAEVSLLEAESQAFSARSDASISAYQLSRVLGRIVDAPEDLKPAHLGSL